MGVANIYLIDKKIGYNDMSDWGYNILRGADIGEKWGTYKP